MKRVLSIFDTNSDGKVSFIEFLVGLSKLAAGTDEFQKTKFAFDVYDLNKDGSISNGELFAVMKMMVGNNLNDQQVRKEEKKERRKERSRRKEAEGEAMRREDEDVSVVSAWRGAGDNYFVGCTYTAHTKKLRETGRERTAVCSLFCLVFLL